VDFGVRDFKLNSFDGNQLTFMLQIDHRESHLKRIEILQFQGRDDHSSEV